MEKQVAAGYFKAHCLELMDIVNETGREFVVTKRGKPVAKLTPVGSGSKRPLRGLLKGQVEILGDIIGPTGEVWNATL
jgi:prevent-host-death family protein